MKKLATRINRKLYLKFLRDVRKITKEMGVKFVLRKRPVIMNRYDSGRPNYGEVEGYYVTGKMYVKYFGKAGRRHILAAVAHELRHAMHEYYGIYSDYYAKKHERAANFAYGKAKRLPKNYQLPNRAVATKAERDCDRFANEMLKKYGIKPIRHTPYPGSQTFAGQVHSWLKRKKPKTYRRLTRRM